MKRLYFASSPRCNEACLFCVRGGAEKPIEYIENKDARRILSEKAKEGYDEIYLDGGEPTLRPDLADLITYSSKAGYRLACVMTNAVLLSETGLADKLTKLKTAKDFQLFFSVSIHSHKKSVSEKLVGRPRTFEKTVQGIDNLLERGAKVSLYHIISSLNYKALPDFVEFVNKRFPGIKHLTFSFIYPAGAALKNKGIMPRLSQVEPYLQAALDRCEKYQIEFSLTTCGFVPLCFLKGHEDILLAQQELDQPGNVGIVDSRQDKAYQLATKEFHGKTKIKSSRCAGCAYDERCGGLWRSYADQYGVGELKPVVKKKDAQSKTGHVFLVMVGFSCNNNCLFCSNIADRSLNRRTEDILADIKEGAGRGTHRILELIGGEVTIRRDFFSLVAAARQAGFEEVSVTTNGKIFSYRSFVEKAVAAGLTKINFSLHGHTKLLHDGATRTPGSFEQCVAGIKNTVGRAGLNVSANTVVSHLNYQQLARIGAFIRDLGVREWHLLELLPDGRAIELYDKVAVPYGRLAPHINKIKKIIERFDHMDVFDFPLCLFDKEFFNNARLSFFTPFHRYEDITQSGGDPFRVEKTINGKQTVYADKYKIKPEFCRRCRHYLNCGGLARPYAERYQDREIRVLAKKHKSLT